MDNPLVQPTAQQTLGEVIHSLQYMAMTIPIPEHENDEGETIVQLSRAQMCGLRNLIQCNQAAIESCYEQIAKELRNCRCPAGDHSSSTNNSSTASKPAT